MLACMGPGGGLSIFQKQMGSSVEAGLRMSCAGSSSPLLSNCDSVHSKEKLRSRKLFRTKFRTRCKLGPLNKQGPPKRYQILENERDRTAVQCSRVQSLQLQLLETEHLQQYLSCINFAMGLDDYSPNQQIIISGIQVLMGMEGKWTLAWSMDGRFYERYEGVELHFEWAFDKEHDPWCADAGGRVSTLDLDDREVCLLASWIRTGYWLTEDGQKHLSIELEQDELGGHYSREIMIAIRLKNSRVVAHLIVDVNTWLPVSMVIKAFGSEDKWEYADWQPFLPGCRSQFPRCITHTPPAGGRDIYSVTSMDVTNLEGKGTCAQRTLYEFPASRLVPRFSRSYPQAHLDNKCLPSVPMMHAESGHYLVRPLIDGQDVGYFIVDTGASSLTIAPHKAAELGMYGFGEAYVTGVEGEVKCQFRRAKSFQLGPLTITAPIFMEVPMAGVVRGASPVAGICGSDIFFHCIVEMSYKRGTLSLFDPLNYVPLHQNNFKWQSMYLLENVPHVTATFNGNEGIFLLDTGAGGVDVIFHGRAVERFKLNQSLELAGTASMKGINTSGKGLQVQYGILNTLEVAGQSFRKVKALFPSKGTCGSLDFSEYTAGVLCGDLLENLLVIFDYGQRQYAFVLDGTSTEEIS